MLPQHRGNSSQLQQMIELEQQINCTRAGIIDMERMRKSSRLLGDCSMRHFVSIREGDCSGFMSLDQRVPMVGNWKPQRYAELMKILRRPYREVKEVKEGEVGQSLQASQSRHEALESHFKSGWKPPLQAGIFVAPCKELKISSKLKRESFQPKSKGSLTNILKIQLSINRRSRASRRSLVKPLLKIQDNPSRHSKDLGNQLIRESITLLPKVRERIKDLTPQRLKSSIQAPRKLSKILRRRARGQRSLQALKAEVSGWTFHNIQQQNP